MAQGGGLPVADSEALRAAAARRLEPDRNGNPALDRLASLAARLLTSTSAQVSLLSADQLIAAGAGLPPGSVGSRGPSAESLCHVTATSGAPLIIPDAASDDRVSTLPPVSSGAVASYLGVPMTADDGHIVGALCVYNATPRGWTEADVAILTQLAASAVAEMELSTLSSEYLSDQLLWALALDAARVGTFEWDVTSGLLTWDRRLLELFGYDEATFDGSFAAFESRVHPDDRARIRTELQHCVDSCGEYSAEYRITRPDGSTRWVSARGRAIGNHDGKMVKVLGAAHDTTVEREADARIARVLESMTAGFLSMDQDWRITYVNAEGERVIGQSRTELTGRTLWEAFPATVGTEFEANYRGAVARDEPVTFEAYYPAPQNAWYEVRAWPNPDGLTLYFLDVSARRLAQDQARAATTRAKLLADVTAEFAVTMDAEGAAARLAQLVVPALADWCVVSLVDADEHADPAASVRDVGWWHADERWRPHTRRFAALRQESLLEGSMVFHALRTAQPVLVRTGATEAIAAVLASESARELITELAPESLSLLPLQARGRTLGLLSLYNGSARGAPSEADAVTAAELASRVGLALDNVRLYSQQRRLAEGLQRALLTAPPQPQHMQIAVRYEAAAEVAQVGGDWYDAFPQPDGATVLVIGDVVGHDTAAAAAMGQLRSLLRGIAAHTNAGPAEVLRGVDQVLQTLQIESTATAIVARVVQSHADGAPDFAQVCWSNAGHPPAMILDEDGSVSVLGGLEADVLLGFDPLTPRVESQLAVGGGCTLLMYTDGLVERRGRSLDVGLQRLHEVLGKLHGLPLEELCDEILRQMLPEQRDDDVALIAVRMHQPDTR